MHGPRLVAEHVVAQREEVLVAAAAARELGLLPAGAPATPTAEPGPSAGDGDYAAFCDRAVTRRTIDHGSPCTTA